ncbi:hypothetical protein DFH06DRAFT_1336287 [Mycena polygramma]|nr:hypothetical protein DFH06DRAFT_1336287 [Mycena polygramma]
MDRYPEAIQESVEESRIREDVRARLNPPFHYVQQAAGLPDEPTEEANVFFARELYIHRAAVNQVKGWLPGARQQQQALEEHVIALAVALRETKVALRYTAEMIVENSSIVASRKKLPVEILGEIFGFAICSKAGYERLRRARIVSHVCRAWRSVMLATDFFWTSIDVTRPMWGGYGWESVTVRPRLGRSTLDGLTNCMLVRSRRRPLDVVISADQPVDPDFLDSLVANCGRWGSLELRSPELICGPRQPSSTGTQHQLVDALARVTGGLTQLHALRLEGHARRGGWTGLGGDSLWQGDDVEERDKLRWLDGAVQLQSVYLNSVTCPEETLLLPWQQITSYREVDSERLHTLPLWHLKSMPNLVDLRLQNVWLPSAAKGTVTIPALQTLHINLDKRERKPDSLPHYDRLQALVLPALQTLELSGDEFCKQAHQPDPGSVQRVDGCVLRLLGRSGPVAKSALTSVTLALSTGVTANFASTILTQIPSLRRFRVRQEGRADVGVMTENFVRIFSTVVLPLVELRIEGALGYPADDDGCLAKGSGWMDNFAAMLRFQFTVGRLVVVDLRPSNMASANCPFREADHNRLREVMGEFPRNSLLLHNTTSYQPECVMRNEGDTDGKSWTDDRASVRSGE